MRGLCLGGRTRVQQLLLYHCPSARWTPSAPQLPQKWGRLKCDTRRSRKKYSCGRPAGTSSCHFCGTGYALPGGGGGGGGSANRQIWGTCGDPTPLPSVHLNACKKGQSTASEAWVRWPWATQSPALGLQVHLDGATVGDSMEKAGMQSVGWVTRGTDIMQSLRGGRSLHIHQRYAFSSALKRMSTIVITQKSEFFVLAKGAPEVLQQLFVSVPDSYEEVYTELMRNGFRVIALGYKALPGVCAADVRVRPASSPRDC